MCKEWDVDKLEDEIPPCVIEEWNEYLDYELETLTRAILGTIPAVNAMGSAGTGGNTTRMTDPEKIGSFLDSIKR